jgi:hypothetical protein
MTPKFHNLNMKEFNIYVEWSEFKAGWNTGSLMADVGL